MMIVNYDIVIWSNVLDLPEACRRFELQSQEDCKECPDIQALGRHRREQASSQFLRWLHQAPLRGPRDCMQQYLA